MADTDMISARPDRVAADAGAALVQRAAGGDRDAFRLIIRTHNQRLYRVARSIVRDNAEAEDVLQEAYMRAFTHLDGFRGQASLATWLSRIVVNEALGRLRSRKRRSRLAAGLEQLGAAAEIIPFPLPAGSESPEKTMAQRQLLALVERLTDELPDGLRTVFVARVIEGLSIEETAELLGLRSETVRTRLYRARALLRQRIEAEVGPLLMDAFPFAGARCDRLTEVVLQRLFPQG